MFWRKKKVIRDAKTVEKCTSCGIERKRDFIAGDVLFAITDPCKSCKNPTRIEQIYAQIRAAS